MTFPSLPNMTIHSKFPNELSFFKISVGKEFFFFTSPPIEIFLTLFVRKCAEPLLLHDDSIVGRPASQLGRVLCGSSDDEFISGQVFVFSFPLLGSALPDVP